MAASYPASLPSFTARIDYVDDHTAADHNDQSNEIVAIATELGTDVAGTQTDLKTRLAQALSGTGNLDFATSSELTIASGAATPTQNWHTIDTQGDAASDDLDTLTATNATDGFVLILRANNDARTVVVKHNTGNILCSGGADLTLDGQSDLVIAIYDGTLSKWIAAGLWTQSVSVDAADVTYTPTTLANWDSDADPGDVDGALDQLAERVDDLEGAAAGFEPDVCMHAKQNADQTGIATSTYTVVVFETEVEDSGGFYSTANGKFLPTSVGTYLVMTHVAIGSLGDGKSVWVGVRKNGTTIRWLGLVCTGAATTSGVGGAIPVYLDGVDDYVEIIVYHNHGSNRDTYSGSADDTCWMSAVRISDDDLCGW